MSYFFLRPSQTIFSLISAHFCFHHAKYSNNKNAVRPSLSADVVIICYSLLHCMCHSATLRHGILACLPISTTLQHIFTEYIDLLFLGRGVVVAAHYAKNRMRKLRKYCFWSVIWRMCARVVSHISLVLIKQSISHSLRCDIYIYSEPDSAALDTGGSSKRIYGQRTTYIVYRCSCENRWWPSICSLGRGEKSEHSELLLQSNSIIFGAPSLFTRTTIWFSFFFFTQRYVYMINGWRSCRMMMTRIGWCCSL